MGMEKGQTDLNGYRNKLQKTLKEEGTVAFSEPWLRLSLAVFYLMFTQETLIHIKVSPIHTVTHYRCSLFTALMKTEQVVQPQLIELMLGVKVDFSDWSEVFLQNA